MDDIMKTIIKLINKFGIANTFSVSFIMIAVFIVKKDFKSEYYAFGSIVAAFCFVMLALFVKVSACFYSHFFIKGNIKVIAWSGWRNKELSKRFNKANFLTYEGQPETMPDLKYDGEEFDVFVTDLLYLNEYYNEGRLVDLSSFNGLCDMHHELVYHLTYAPCKKTNKRIGIPVEFGFSELLINKDWFINNSNTSNIDEEGEKHRSNFIKKLTDNDFSYYDFELQNLLKCFPNIKIGIWDWYIPALFHLLLIDKKPDDDISIHNLAEQTKDRVKEATRIISEKPKNFRILHDLSAIKHAIQSKSNALIIGSGSSALSKKDINSGYMPIVPKEGVLMWVNCLTVINIAGAGVERARPLIEHWNSNQIQNLLANKESYRSCPVLDEELKKLIVENHPSAKTLTKYLSDSPPNIALREIPKYSREWQMIWSTVRNLK